MEYGYDFPKSKFYRALMTGFFVGFIATFVCLAYNIIFRDSTGFSLSAFINVSSIIFFVNILFPVIGIIYYGFISSFKKSDIIFTILFLVLTVFFVWRTEMTRRTNDHLLNAEFKNLLLGIVIILGISASVFIPLLYHNKKFTDAVL
ncbi:MAG TPA: hypothetical protein VGQ53_18225 [Chitinophagaceae bacterium]|jgi:hypothetical protein|nr:hypothetical protein [Chitinophagaceae bacterium]